MESSTLVSASCTTGWSDWVHGELWLTPLGLLRNHLGLAATVRHLLGRTVDPDAPPTRDLRDDDIARLSTAHRRNTLVRKEDVRQARLHIGASTGRLLVTTADGGLRKFLWLKQDHAERTLEPALRRWIGEAVSYD